MMRPHPKVGCLALERSHAGLSGRSDITVSAQTWRSLAPTRQVLESFWLSQIFDQRHAKWTPVSAQDTTTTTPTADVLSFLILDLGSH